MAQKVQGAVAHHTVQFVDRFGSVCLGIVTDPVDGYQNVAADSCRGMVSKGQDISVVVVLQELGRVAVLRFENAVPQVEQAG